MTPPAHLPILAAHPDEPSGQGVPIPLSRIAGECISAASKQLPSPLEETRPQVVDTVAPLGVGPVRLYFEHFRPSAQQRRRGVASFWVCDRAEARAANRA